MNFFHQNIETLRKRFGLSQASMGERYDISQTGYSRWEKSTVPDLETIIDLARFFRVSIDDLLTKDLSQENPHTHPPGAATISEPGSGEYLSEEDMEMFKTLEAELAIQRKMMEEMMKEMRRMNAEIIRQGKELEALKKDAK